MSAVVRTSLNIDGEVSTAESKMLLFDKHIQNSNKYFFNFVTAEDITIKFLGTTFQQDIKKLPE